MATNLVEKVVTVTSSLPADKQQEILDFAESVAQRKPSDNLPEAQTQHSSPARRRMRTLKGATADGTPSVTSEEIEEARREMWRGYMSGDDE